MEIYLDHDDVSDERCHLIVTREQLLLFAGSMNEAIEAVDDWEYPTRLGVDKGAARRTLDELSTLIRALPPAH